MFYPCQESKGEGSCHCPEHIPSYSLLPSPRLRVTMLVPVVKSPDTLIRALYTVNYDQQQYKINHVISSFSFIVKSIISLMLLKFYRIQLLALRLLTTKHEALGSMKILKCLPRSHLASKRENFLYHSKLLHSNCSLSPGKF